MLGAPNMLVFDADGICCSLSGRHWRAAFALRAGKRSRSNRPSRTGPQAGLTLRRLLKLLILPFRIVWLLVVWFYLRSTAKRRLVG
jgi:hypothetical protein